MTGGPEPGPAARVTPPGPTGAAEGSHPADAESRYRAHVDRNLPRNYVAHLLHGLLGQTGFRLVNAPTFLPAYVQLLSGSEFMVGLARSIQYLGMFLSPLLGASMIEHRRRVLPVGFVVGGLMRLQVLGLALAGLLLPPEQAMRVILVALFLFGFFMGMQGVVFNYLLSKVIPVERRGRLLGLRNALAGVTAAGVAYLGGRYLVEPDVWGNGYAVTFLVAFALTTLGLSMLLLVREPEPPEVRAPMLLRERLRDLPQLLRSDRGFTWYFVCRALATMGRMATPFYILQAGAVIGLSGTTVGLLSTAFVLANSVANLGWGMLADRTGFKRVFVLSLGLWSVSVVALMTVSTLTGFVLVFLGIGTGMGGFMMAAQNMVLEFGSRSDLPLRIAIANSAQELVGAIGPLLGGILAVSFGREVVYQVAIGFQLAAIGFVSLLVEEPRHREE
ncbi:MAG: MFS transporter [Myxococcota bacterium]|nr:MFS transporter [Myxococcota bacterium]